MQFVSCAQAITKDVLELNVININYNKKHKLTNKI